MNKSKLITAIFGMAILATAVAFASCKKDDENAPNTKAYTVQQAADIRQMEDPLAYMMDFKKQLTESKGNEAFGLEDAAWHLACLANLDFCNVNVEYDDFLFDTVEMQVNVTDGVILLGDLRTAYEQMCMEIQQFRKGFNHCDQNLYYVNVAIEADGNAKIAVMSSYTSVSKDWLYHQWYFSDVDELFNTCIEYFDTDSIYVWNTTAASELQRVLNLFEHHENGSIGAIGGSSQCFVPTRNHTFSYNNTYDPYMMSELFHLYSRVFAKCFSYYDPYYVLTLNELCYCLDSYLGLGYDFISNSLYVNEHPVNWTIIPEDKVLNNWYYYYHYLYVEYGSLITYNPPGPEPD